MVTDALALAPAPAPAPSPAPKDDDVSEYYDVQEDDDGRVRSVTFFHPNKQPLVRTRPEDSDDDNDGPWFRLFDRLQPVLKKSRKIEGALQVVHTAIEPHLAHMAHLVLPEERKAIVWPNKALPRHAYDAINGKFFLLIEEGTHDVHGKKYVPNADSLGKKLAQGTKVGSCCAGSFPHGIMQIKKRLKSKECEPQFIVGTDRIVVLTVRLYKHADGGVGNPEPCSEEDVLKIVRGAYNESQTAKWGDLENKMLLHLSLQWGDTDTAEDDPVHRTDFAAPRGHDGLFVPTEEPPHALDGAPAGFYEFEMTNGVASIRFHLHGATTTPGLKEEHKLRPFRFAVRAMNPYLASHKGFFVKTVPFHTKQKITKYTHTAERYVMGIVGDSPGVVASPPHDARIPTPYAWWRQGHAG